jgi:hypothetical protein
MFLPVRARGGICMWAQALRGREAAQLRLQDLLRYQCTYAVDDFLSCQDAMNARYERERPSVKS